MTRIIAGFAGSLTLTVPRVGTRPTSDRVREAVFSAVDARDAVRGAHVLDLYAGSGALGLEAASRGAATVTLVEKSRAAAEVCRRNTAAILSARPPGSELAVEVTSSPVQAFLGASGAEFDLVFIDPPYELGEAELLHNLEALVPRLAPHAIVVVERSSRSPRPGLPAGLELDRRKDYGETTLWWLGPIAGSGDDGV
ncbi:16S rRNA (guanine(966)-N(2))-methyltransferase RsmD [Compostimonas suwonensis]|uniref:16S rRNA (Guanine966-N2)-methyltransferase n=1 Tax=Compostimonas suwonensis TaxID=1048394 RepID=A0A2M9C020_9MICO|nr:16S rRNA (guanine(966)-N(2))-methyltransferase RsmD [Compostimonas suwonensis]PJJ63662.1 16S rRNA (guanine966-N2)-methyltransferase [Compostimonas suwonensis]